MIRFQKVCLKWIFILKNLFPNINIYFFFFWCGVEFLEISKGEREMELFNKYISSSSFGWQHDMETRVCPWKLRSRIIPANGAPCNWFLALPDLPIEHVVRDATLQSMMLKVGMGWFSISSIDNLLTKYLAKCTMYLVFVCMICFREESDLFWREFDYLLFNDIFLRITSKLKNIFEKSVIAYQLIICYISLACIMN